ncbi:hypothetical protein, partial [Nonomuraea sp. NPDC049784]|uniref:hypothetical protein n=1 Tax=Nonomuraea sp. NPDC049784 TaxID=3154361 RepID=UPI0033D41920
MQLPVVVEYPVPDVTEDQHVFGLAGQVGQGRGEGRRAAGSTRTLRCAGSRPARSVRHRPRSATLAATDGRSPRIEPAACVAAPARSTRAPGAAKTRDGSVVVIAASALPAAWTGGACLA